MIQIGDKVKRRVSIYDPCAPGHQQTENMDAVVEYMMKSGLFQRSEGEAAYRFFTDATRRTYYNSYFYGRWLVANAYALFPQDRKSEFYRLVYDNPHTNSTFIKAVEQATGKSFEPFATDVF